ncbi:FtsB family cell division protein [Acuticoccus mangrovi]|uniref:Septum formation initiator family protein n=1 Tax=Acuticoccus mangrovi TaxID=2796142 RepID=A0A934IGR6_9HYPH|nr:septum formation initiator family protein [Acuticoccus mangrovi]MBJ3774691.1 septum formation initiator family protein [Acuticoccus mangrovi]
MPTRHRRRSRFAFLLFPLIFGAVSCYFVWQSTRGEFSQEARAELKAERSAREAEFASLVTRRTDLQDRVRRLRTDALDADLLDERARAQLNMAHPNEVVIFHDERAGATARLEPGVAVGAR